MTELKIWRDQNDAEGNGRVRSKTIKTHIYNVDTGRPIGIIKTKIKSGHNVSIDDGPPPINPRTGKPETTLQPLLPRVNN